MIFKVKKILKIFHYLIIFFLSIYLLIFLKSLSINLEPKLDSSCGCREYLLPTTQMSKNIYTINNKWFELNQTPVLTCDSKKSLQRGPNQKIISYSLYGQNPRYYKLLKEIIFQVKTFYPDFTMRVYYDDSINKSIICPIECSSPHVDFCNIHKVPISLNDSQNMVDLSYINAKMWRFLPIGDSFVDTFVSRDLDSQILERELNSVNEWIGSGNVGHIMRDNPVHGTFILGGMWGFQVKKDRNLGKSIFENLIDKDISLKFNKDKKNPDGLDQTFLSKHVYNLINNNSTIHDSFLCSRYKNSKPWPTKRKGNCFVGRIGRCNETGVFKICPIECRPKNHLDWETC